MAEAEAGSRSELLPRSPAQHILNDRERFPNTNPPRGTYPSPPQRVPPSAGWGLDLSKSSSVLVHLHTCTHSATSCKEVKMVKLTVKTIKGKKFQIEVEQTQTVRRAPLNGRRGTFANDRCTRRKTAVLSCALCPVPCCV